MTLHRMIELLEIEMECVRRNGCGECNRACHVCDLLQDDTELHEMYAEVIARMKAQEPRIVTEMDFENADEAGFIPAWCEEKDTGEVYCECIPIGALEDAKSGRVRWWTSRPDEERRAETPWDC